MLDESPVETASEEGNGVPVDGDDDVASNVVVMIPPEIDELDVSVKGLDVVTGEAKGAVELMPKDTENVVRKVVGVGEV